MSEVMRLSAEIGEEYSSSLADLTMNSKPLINMLTILAEENIKHAPTIVQSVEKHLDQVRADIKLPVLYLVDSIIKNVGGQYTQLFSQTIVGMFCRVFKQVDEKTRFQMFKLRETWNDVFPAIRLYQLDVKVNLMDPAWPVPQSQTNIHVNPNFLLNSTREAGGSSILTESVSSAVPSSSHLLTDDKDMHAALVRKEQELLLLKKKKIELELEQTKRQLQLQQRLHNTTQLSVPVLPAVAEPVAVSLTSVVVPVPTLTTALPGAPKAKTTIVSQLVGSGARIAPASSIMVNHARRRDPRLSKVNSQLQQTKPKSITTSTTTPTTITVATSNTTSSKPITVSVRPTRRDRERERDKDKEKIRFSKLPPIPKISKSKTTEHSKHATPSPTPATVPSPNKKKKEHSVSPKTNKPKKHKDTPTSPTKESPSKTNKEVKKHKPKVKEDVMEVDIEEKQQPVETFKELKNSTKERNYIRRNRDKSESPEVEREGQRKGTDTEGERQGQRKGTDTDLRDMQSLLNNADNTSKTKQRDKYNVVGNKGIYTLCREYGRQLMVMNHHITVH